MTALIRGDPIGLEKYVRLEIFFFQSGFEDLYALYSNSFPFLNGFKPIIEFGKINIFSDKEPGEFLIKIKDKDLVY